MNRLIGHLYRLNELLIGFIARLKKHLKIDDDKKLK